MGILRGLGAWYEGALPVLMAVECLFFVVIPVAAVVSGAPRAAATDVLVITTAIGFVTMLTQQLFASWNQSRLHREEMENRSQIAALAREQVAAQSEKLRLQTELRAAEVRLLLEQSQAEAQRELQLHHDAMRTLIEENIEFTQQGVSAAHDAYHEANQANQKIAELQRQGVLPTATPALADDDDEPDDFL